MKTFKQDIQLLSAYIDGELSQKEKIYIEGKISASLELQKELAELKRLKELTSSAYERIPESHFFQTRLNIQLTSEKPLLNKFKKWIPALSLTILTIGLMAVLKLNPNLIKNIIEEQKSNLVSLYKENLQPLLYAADLTNEDIFNFAFNSELPLDKTDQHILKLGYDPNGTEFFEIKKASVTNKENNLEKFVQALDLNEIQRKEIDSIISSYSDELLAQVLVNDKNAVAINPHLWNYRKAIAAEILAYAKSKNAYVYQSIVPSQLTPLENIQVAEFVNNLRPSKDEKYIFFTPDTIFTDTFVFDDRAFRKDMSELQKDLVEAKKNIAKVNYHIRIDTTLKRFERDSSWAEEFSVQIDADKFKVSIPKFIMPGIDIPLPPIDSINALVNDAIKRAEIYVHKIPGEKSREHKIKVEVRSGDSTEINNFNFNRIFIDSLMNDQFRSLDSLKRLDFDSFHFFDDSSSSGFNFFLNDSIMFNQSEELRRQMNELKEEMRKFREEIRNFQMDPPSNSDTVKPKLKGIEI